MTTPLTEVPAEHRPGTPEYAAATTPFNLAVRQRPALTVPVASTAQAAAVVRSAAERGLRVAVQSTGHGAASLPPLAGTLLLHVGELRDLSVDPTARTATFGPGIRAAELAEAAAVHGLAAPMGFAPTVGFTGYALGGGLGWFARRRGFAAWAIEGATLVTADGNVRTVSADHDRELLWALRGGAAGLGVVTSLTVSLEPTATVHGGALYWPVERAREVLRTWTSITRTLPDDVTSVGRILAVPPIPEVPEPLRGCTWAVVESVHATADATAHDILLAQLRSLDPTIDTVGALPTTALGRLHGDPETPLPVVGDHALLGDLGNDGVDALVDTVGAGTSSPLVNVELRHLGGALARPRIGAEDRFGAIAPTDAHFCMHAIGMAGDAGSEAAAEDRLSALRRALDPWDTAGRLANFCERPLRPQQIHADETLAHLAAIARRVDPEGRFVTALDPEVHA